MRETIYLVRRNILLYLRDRSTVFFSVLSMLIILALAAIFLGSMHVESLMNILDEFGIIQDRAQARENAEYLISVWTLSGILLSNAVTVTMTAMQTMIQDETSGKLAAFYTAPVKRIRLSLSYVLSSFMIGSVMCILTFLVGEGYMLLRGYPLLTVSDWPALFGMLLLNVFVYAAAACLLTLFVHSESAWGGLLTIVGTLVGFVGATYLPMGTLPAGVGNVLKFFPVLHGTAMLRQVMTKDAILRMFAGLPEEVSRVYREEMGITVIMGQKTVTLTAQLLFLSVCALLSIGVAALLGRRRRTRI